MSKIVFHWSFPRSKYQAVLTLIKGECPELFSEKIVVFDGSLFGEDATVLQEQFINELKQITKGEVKLISRATLNPFEKKISMTMRNEKWPQYYQWQVERALKKVLGRGIDFSYE